MEALQKVLQSKEAQRGLISLYADSQVECTRNGACGMEIGMAREKDLCAVLKYFLKDTIQLEIQNSLPEDFLISGEKVSVKHSQSKVGAAVKAKWTSADKSVESDIKAMIEAPDEYYPHLLLIYLSVPEKKITIVCISKEKNKEVIQNLREEAFKVPKGNSRGIEYSSKAMKSLMKDPVFQISMENCNLLGGMNPIDKRMQFLASQNISPILS